MVLRVLEGLCNVRQRKVILLMSNFKEDIDQAPSRKPTVRKSTEIESAVSLLSHRVTDALRKDILSGKLAPGSRIRQEDIAQQFDVSRIPVREALQQLESEGLVMSRANSGAWVAKLDLEEFMQIYKVRERLEPLALRESMLNLTPQQLTLLVDLHDRMSMSNNVEEFLQLDREFHLQTYAGMKMTMLRQMIEKFWNTTQHFRRMFKESVSTEGTWIIHAEHRLLIEAIKRRDEDEAERILLGHIRRTRLDLMRRNQEK
jgi:DNA-binding GntR family transcriptional regulator